jgi:hypothetical protein
LDVDTIFGDLKRECLHQRVVRNTIFSAELQRGPILHNGAKKKLQLKHKNSLFTLQTFHYTGQNAHTEYDLKNRSTSDESEVISCEKTMVESYSKQTCQILSDKDFLSFVVTNFCQEFHRTFLSNFMTIIIGTCLNQCIFTISCGYNHSKDNFIKTSASVHEIVDLNIKKKYLQLMPL